MRKFIKITLLVLINLLFFFTGFFLFNNITYEITKYTLDNEIIDSLIAVGTFAVTIFICVYALSKIRFLKQIIIGFFFSNILNYSLSNFLFKLQFNI